VRAPMSTSKKVIQQTMDEMTGLIENSALDTLVAWVRDLLDRVTVDGREEHAVTIWRTATDDGVNRSDSVSSWLRRAGAGHLLRFRGETASEFPLPPPCALARVDEGRVGRVCAMSPSHRAHVASPAPLRRLRNCSRSRAEPGVRSPTPRQFPSALTRVPHTGFPVNHSICLSRFHPVLTKRRMRHKKQDP
jgi:hypothetical protein